MCQSNQNKNRQIITFQAAKIQHKPRCVSLKNGENLNKICISALPLTPPYTEWGQNYLTYWLKTNEDAKWILGPTTFEQHLKSIYIFWF